MIFSGHFLFIGSSKSSFWVRKCNFWKFLTLQFVRKFTFRETFTSHWTWCRTPSHSQPRRCRTPSHSQPRRCRTPSHSQLRRCGRNSKIVDNFRISPAPPPRWMGRCPTPLWLWMGRCPPPPRLWMGRWPAPCPVWCKSFPKSELFGQFKSQKLLKNYISLLKMNFLRSL